MAKDNEGFGYISGLGEFDPARMRPISELESEFEKSNVCRHSGTPINSLVPELVATQLNHRAIWARWNKTGGAIQRARVRSDDE